MKYIIEIDDNPMRCADGTLLWKAKGFNSLTFDITGLSRLRKPADKETMEVGTCENCEFFKDEFPYIVGNKTKEGYNTCFWNRVYPIKVDRDFFCAHWRKGDAE